MFQLCKFSYFNLKLCAFLMLTLFVLNNAQAQKPLRFSNNATSNNAANLQQNVYSYPKDKTSIISKVKGFGKDGLFTAKDKHIGYSLRLENKLKEVKTGIIVMQISSGSGAALYKENHPFTIKKKGSYTKDYVFDAKQLQPGFYISSMSISTDKYADTASYSFGFEPEKVYVKNNPPQTLVNFWNQAQQELMATPANYILTPRPDLAKKDGDAYEVEFNSTDKATIFGWLTVPKGNRKSPVLYKISDYMSELAPEFRRDVAVLCINTRGTGSSTTNYNFAYNDLGLLNLKDKNKYVLKGIYLDAFRGLDLIHQFASKLKLDNRKVVITGSGLGASASVVLAALNQSLKGIILESPTFMDIRNMMSFNDGMLSSTFPASMYQSFYNTGKNNKETMLATLDFFDPLFFAPYINCPVLTGFGLKNLNSPAQCVYNFISQLRIQKKDNHICKECGVALDKGFYGFKEMWLKEKFGQP